MTNDFSQVGEFGLVVMFGGWRLSPDSSVLHFGGLGGMI